jgi:ferredoxin
MSIEILLDQSKCTGLGLCEAVAPDMFEVQDDGMVALLVTSVDDARLTDVEAAVSACPTEALSFRS